MVQFLVLPSKEAMAPLTVPVEISDGREARDAQYVEIALSLFTARFLCWVKFSNFHSKQVQYYYIFV